jgi:uncharacterized protein YbaR (Trm112 family)
MDLLGCPRCRERFVSRDAGSGRGLPCPDCSADLLVIAHSVSLGIVRPQSFDSSHLQSVSRSMSGPPFISG